VTAVVVIGRTVKVAVLADGPSVCDPAQTGVPLGEPVRWTAMYDLLATYKRRAQATIRVFYESYVHGARWESRPKTISDTRRGARTSERVTGIRWTSFGGTTATGFGTLRLDYCRPGDSCPTNGKRIRLVASKPDYCKDSGKIEYLRLAGYIGKLERFGGIITCPPEPAGAKLKSDLPVLVDGGRLGPCKRSSAATLSSSRSSAGSTGLRRRS